MTRHLLALGRLLGIALYSAVPYTAVILTWPVALVSRSLRARIHVGLLRIWSRGVAWLMGIRIEAEGHAPAPPYILVSNHLSYVDIVVLQALTGCVFLAKSEVARWPVIGFLARTSGNLFVDRTQRMDLPRAVEAISRVAIEGHGVAFFPEGTSTDGSSVLPFKPSLFEVAIRTGLPVYCASLGYAVPEDSPPAHLSVCWWGDMEFFSHLYALLQIPSFRARVAFADQPVSREVRESSPAASAVKRRQEGSDRKELAERARRSVEAHFFPVVTHSSCPTE